MDLFSDILTDDKAKALPILVADDDFLEYLRENTYEECDSIELDEILILWDEWQEENVE